jgi:hypothetical protein
LSDQPKKRLYLGRVHCRNSLLGFFGQLPHLSDISPCLLVLQITVSLRSISRFLLFISPLLVLL